MVTVRDRAASAEQPMTTRSERRAMGSAVLSFVLPGLGQLVSARWRSGLLFLLPILVLIVMAAVTISDAIPISVVLDPRLVTAALVVSILLFAWRAAAVLHAFAIHAPWAGTRPSVIVAWVLIALVAVTQAVPTAYLARLAGTLDQISDQTGSDDDRLLGPAPSAMPSFEGEGAVDASRSPAPSPTSTIDQSPSPSTAATPTATPTREPTPPPTATPAATPAPDTVARLEERVTVLLLGTDDLANRSHRLTDTMLVVSLGADDPRPIMISIPRDTYGVPLPDGRVYNARLNSLASYARARPEAFPLGGVGTLRETIEMLIGLEIDYVASIDMLGLVEIVDAVGGVTVYVTSPIDDPYYRPATGGPRGFQLDAGWQAMDGATALAYARSRKGEGGSDFVRAGRQQRLLAAIRDRVRELGLVSTLPTLLDVVDANVRTDIPRDRLGHFAEAVVDANWDGLERLVLQPPTYMTAGFTDSGAYVLWPDIPAIRAAVDRLVPD